MIIRCGVVLSKIPVVYNMGQRKIQHWATGTTADGNVKYSVWQS